MYLDRFVFLNYFILQKILSNVTAQNQNKFKEREYENLNKKRGGEAG